MSRKERSPILTKSLNSNVLSSVEKQSQYGVVEVDVNQADFTTSSSKFCLPGKLASVQTVVLVIVGIAVVIVLGITVFSSDDQVSNVLKQSNPTTANENDGSPGYRDITIPQGRLRGFTKKSRQGRDYTAYYKVPYAEPPIGDLRMKDPIAPRTSWQGLRSIPVVAPQCIQKEKYSDVIQAVGEEDCLYSNIYVPVISQQQEESLPVMVYIHGGGFTDGNGSRYGAEYFMDEDVILITFQFRLGPFGFLNTNDDTIHGNMAFKDQVQMLIWTRDNAKYFGGDPNRVTIFGNSAGAMSVSFLMLSPMANGLFHRSITQSGASLCAGIAGGMVNLDPIPTINEVGRVLNCDTTDSTAFLGCLRTKDASEIALVRSSPVSYSLTIEKRSDNQAFMPDTPYNILKSNPNKVPNIVGVVTSEFTGDAVNLITNEQLAKNMNEDFPTYGARVLGTTDMSDEELLSIKTFYFGDKEIGNSTFREGIKLVSDRIMNHCSYVNANMQSEFSPTYLYYLSKPPALSYTEKDLPGFPAKELGMVEHGDELQYLFLYEGYPEITTSNSEYFEFSRYLVNQWATFAANGAPTSDWQPISGDSSANSTFWFELNDNPGRTDVLRERLDFWNQFTDKQLRYNLDVE